MSAEALLTPGSIGSIIGSIITTALNLGSLARDIANAPEHIQKVCTEAELCRTMVITIKALLYQIETDGVNKDAQELIYVSSLAKALVGCHEALNSLEQEVKGLMKDNMKIGKDERARWVWREQEIDKHLRSLEAHKATLNITLNVLNIQQVRELRKQNAELLNYVMGITGKDNVLAPQGIMRCIGPSSNSQQLGTECTANSTRSAMETLSEVFINLRGDSASSANACISAKTSETDYFEAILLASRVYQKKKFSKSPLLHSNLTWSELHHSGASIFSYRPRSLPITIALVKTRAPMAILSKNLNRLNDALVKAIRKRDIEAMSIFLQYGADVNLIDGNGETPLHSATAEGDIEIAKVLLAHGADINAVNKSYETPLHYSFVFGQWDVVELLQQHGAGVCLKNRSQPVDSKFYSFGNSNDI